MATPENPGQGHTFHANFPHFYLTAGEPVQSLMSTPTPTGGHPYHPSTTHPFYTPGESVRCTCCLGTVFEFEHVEVHSCYHIYRDEESRDSGRRYCTGVRCLECVKECKVIPCHGERLGGCAKRALRVPAVPAVPGAGPAVGGVGWRRA
ncbi:hypothetical protein BJ508DRAFT_327590 [Ascobolus immersus RN42]|uniref:Uncharacterized protein n=1 Tax=Ascobolus immersus RN42 TaxID=1160509 RepID=A0A3N4I828_ASCIM|nr:hypothetical protein BJ508DRAFT_327590 [Ascobolus immersus RN42]